MDQSQLKAKLELLKEPFDDSQIEEREGNGGQSFKYVPIDLVIQRLDEVFPLSWSWQVLDSKVIDTEIEKRTGYDKSTQPWTPIIESVPLKQVSVLGRLTLHLSEGESVFRDSWGGSDLGKGGQAGDDFKIADSNALSKAAYRFGVAAHIGLEVLEEKKNNPRQKNTKQRYNNSGGDNSSGNRNSNPVRNSNTNSNKSSASEKTANRNPLR